MGKQRVAFLFFVLRLLHSQTGICLGIPLQYIKGQFPEEYAVRNDGCVSLRREVERVPCVITELSSSYSPARIAISFIYSANHVFT